MSYLSSKNYDRVTDLLKVPLNEICTEIYRYPSFYGMEHLTDGVPVIRGEHILDDGNLSNNWSDYWFVSDEINSQYPRTQLIKGDLVFSVRGTIGKIGLVNSEHIGANMSPNLIRISPNQELVHSKYLWFFLRSSNGQLAITERTSSTTISTIQASTLKKLPIPLPPISEQRRIVEILDQADAMRKKRAEADKLAERILPALFIKMFGDPATNPMRWPSGVLGDITTETQYGTSTRANTDIRGVPVLRMNNIDIRGNLDLSSLKYIDLESKEIEKYSLKKGDLLFNRTNSAELVGKTGLWNLDIQAVPASYLIRFRVDTNKVLPEFIWAYMNMPFIKQVLFDKARRAIGMANINAKELQALPAFFPSLKAQMYFCEGLENISKVRLLAQKQQEILDSLFQNLLHRAFSGELTAEWRNAHLQELLQEMEHQAKALGIPYTVEYEQLGMFS